MLAELKLKEFEELFEKVDVYDPEIEEDLNNRGGGLSARIGKEKDV